MFYTFKYLVEDSETTNCNDFIEKEIILNIEQIYFIKEPKKIRFNGNCKLNLAKIVTLKNDIFFITKDQYDKFNFFLKRKGRK